MTKDSGDLVIQKKKGNNVSKFLISGNILHIKKIFYQYIFII